MSLYDQTWDWVMRHDWALVALLVLAALGWVGEKLSWFESIGNLWGWMRRK